MTDLLRWLASSESFMPHGSCYLWQPVTLWLNAGSDLLIAASYFAIPAVLYVFARRRMVDARYVWVPLTFAAFIFLCGSTHVMEVVTIWNPLYRAAGALKLLTGIVSFLTLLSLIRVLPGALLLKTPGELRVEVEARTQELKTVNEQLRAEIAARDDAERQLRREVQERARADALLRTIVESAPSLIYAKDRQGRMLLANPPALGLIGKSWPEVAGRTDREFLDDPQQGEAIVRTDLRVMEQNRAEVVEEAVGAAGGDPRIWHSIKAPLRDEQGTVTGLVGVSVEITESKRLEHRLRLMVSELNHRVKNSLTAVQAIAAQTLRGAHPELYAAFQSRLASLAAAHDVLSRERWAGAEIADVADGQLQAFSGLAAGRIDIGGPRIRLNARAAVSLAMALHELATNAAKYGALSTADRRIVLRWNLVDAPDELLQITWSEREGPPISVPARRGFGSRFIETLLARDLGATVTLEFDSGGLTCRIVAPLAPITASASAAQLPHVGIALGHSA